MFSFLEYINTNLHDIWVWIHKHKNRTVSLFSYSKYSSIFLGSDYFGKKYPIFTGDWVLLNVGYYRDHRNEPLHGGNNIAHVPGL